MIAMSSLRHRKGGGKRRVKRTGVIGMNSALGLLESAQPAWPEHALSTTPRHKYSCSSAAIALSSLDQWAPTSRHPRRPSRVTRTAAVRSVGRPVLTRRRNPEGHVSLRYGEDTLVSAGLSRGRLL
jgi:hypothetical protein